MALHDAIFDLKITSDMEECMHLQAFPLHLRLIVTLQYVRKSVEGLSMYMFVFAFLGNSFYVASILLSPEFLAAPPASTAYIRESIPWVHIYLPGY